MKAAEQNYDETVKAREINKLILEAISEAISQHSAIPDIYGSKGAHYRANADVSPIALIESA